MADYNSSLPVRTQNNGDVVIEVSDGTTPSQKLAVNSSGSAQVAGQGVAGTPAGGVVSVQGVSGGTAIPVSGTVTATNASVSSTGAAVPASATFVGGQATTSAPTYVTGDLEPLSLNLAGGLRVDGSGVTQPVSGTVTANQGGAPWSQNLTQLSGAAPSASNSLPVQITTGSTYVSASNPLPVTIDPVSVGTAKNYYTDSAAIAVGTTATQSTTAAGTTGFYLEQIVVSGSGKFKAVVQIGGITYFAAFNSTAQPTVVIPVPNNTLVATGTVVQVLMTNLDLAAQDLYSTLSGFQI